MKLAGTIKKFRGWEGALAGLILLLNLPVVFSHENYLLTWFNIDDGFYFFVVARNLAAGQGFTFDGIAATNGFHPLWLFLITPVFALPGKILPLRILVVLLALLSAGTAVLVFRLAAKALARGTAFLAALAFALLPAIHTFTVRGGMEAGLSAFLIALLLYRLQKTGPGSARNVLLLGLVGSLAFLARLDNIFLVGFAGVALVLKNWEGWQDLRAFFKKSYKPSALFLAPLLLTLAIYLTWNQLSFGTLTPVSGQVKRWWGTLDNAIYGFPPSRLANYVGQVVTDDPNIGPFSLATAPLYRVAEAFFGETVGARRVGLALIGGGILGGLGFLAWKRGRWMASAAGRIGLGPLFAGGVFQIAYYKVGGSVAQRPWYWVQEELLIVLAGVVCFEAVLRITSDRLNANKLIAISLVTFLTILLIVPHLERLQRIYSPSITDWDSFYLRRAGWLESHTEPGSLIGMTGSGSSAYFTDGRTIVNLDGLIGSTAYFEHLRAGTAYRYLEEIGLDYVFGNAYILTESDPYAGIFAGRLEESAVFIDGDRELPLWHFVPGRR